MVIALPNFMYKRYNYILTFLEGGVREGALNLRYMTCQNVRGDQTKLNIIIHIRWIM